MAKAAQPTKPKLESQNNWSEIIKVTSSPLKLFALIVLVCNSIFGIAAAWAFGEDVFIYTLHTFLAVVATFALIALWSPRSFYSPAELLALYELELRNQDAKPVFPEAKPIVPTLIAAFFVLVYALYHLWPE